MLVKAAVQVTHWASIPRLEVNFAPKQSDQSESGCLETLICWHIRPTNQRASQSTNQRSCWIPRKAPNRSTAADGDTEEEEKKNELVDPHVALRATCARELERYGANPKVALDWSVCILADIPDLFDSWFTTVSPALAKLAPRSFEQMDKLSPPGASQEQAVDGRCAQGKVLEQRIALSRRHELATNLPGRSQLVLGPWLFYRTCSVERVL